MFDPRPEISIPIFGLCISHRKISDREAKRQEAGEKRQKAKIKSMEYLVARLC